MTYNAGDIVTVKAEVTAICSDGTVEVKIARRGPAAGSQRYVNIDPEDIDRRLPKPAPPEPDETFILRDRIGGLWTRSGKFWKTPGSNNWAWGSQFIQEFGPFDVFAPSDKVGV